MREWKMYFPLILWVPCFLAQIVLVFIFGVFNEAGLDVVMYMGWGIWGISLVFGWLPILTLKRKGGVPEGKGYVHTTALVDSGLYSIIRHPQYTAGLLFSLALILISQSWLILILGVVVISSLYVDILMADRLDLDKFGDEYKRYMREVPRTNFILGIIRQLRRRGKN
ncbi:MAG: methyltransferase family protein [Candidatus Thorarchaeota archaeon]